MRDIENFCKLYKVTIPIHRHFDFYVDTLVRAGDNKLMNYINLYNERESQVENMYNDKKGYYETIKEVLKGIPASMRFNLDSNYVQDNDLYMEDEFPVTGNIRDNSNDNTIFISIDLVKANYQTLKSFDHEGELKSSWDEFLGFHNVPEVYVQSKHFRQFIFEQSNPKRTQRYQRKIMCEVLKCIKRYLGFLIQTRLVYRSADELIFALPLKMLKFRDTFDTLCAINGLYYPVVHKKEFRVTIFKNEYISGDIAIRTILDKDLNPIKKELKSVPGNRYFMYLRKYILNEDPHEYDLLFKCDGQEAKWVNNI